MLKSSGISRNHQFIVRTSEERAIAPSGHFTLKVGPASSVAQLARPAISLLKGHQALLSFDGRVFDWPGCDRKVRHRPVKDAASVHAPINASPGLFRSLWHLNDQNNPDLPA